MTVSVPGPGGTSAVRCIACSEPAVVWSSGHWYCATHRPPVPPLATATPVEREQRLRQALGRATEVLYACDEFLGNVTGWDGTHPDELNELRADIAALLAAPDDGGEPG